MKTKALRLKFLFTGLVLIAFTLLLPLPSNSAIPGNRIKDTDSIPGDTTLFLMWNPEIQAFDSLNKVQPDPQNAILFTGSSSIRLWSTLKEDMSPFPVIQRGYGGAKLDDYAYFAKRIIYPHQFRAIVFFIANDITNRPEDKTPEEMIGYIDQIMKLVRAKYPETPVFWIEITPTMNRWSVWDKTKEANSAIKNYCDDHQKMYFIETANYFMNPDGTPNVSLFREDRLHLNSDGYRLWTSIIKAKLESVLGSE